MSRRKLGIIIIAAVILVDQLTKILMIDKQITIIPSLLEFSYAENTGGAFSIGNKNMVYLIIISAILLGLILKFMKENSPLIDKYVLISLNFVLAGGISNLIDRIFRGHVVDFIDINIFNFPNFNIADICITLGISALILITIKSLFKNI